MHGSSVISGNSAALCRPTPEGSRIVPLAPRALNRVGVIFGDPRPACDGRPTRERSGRVPAFRTATPGVVTTTVIPLFVMHPRLARQGPAATASGTSPSVGNPTTKPAAISPPRLLCTHFPNHPAAGSPINPHSGVLIYVTLSRSLLPFDSDAPRRAFVKSNNNGVGCRIGAHRQSADHIRLHLVMSISVQQSSDSLFLHLARLT